MDQSLTNIVGCVNVEWFNVHTEPHREDWSMQTKLRYVGLDVHKESIVVAVAEGNRSPAAVVSQLANDWPALLRTLRRLGSTDSLRLCYEAGPTGFELARRLKAEGYDVLVVAPSLVPKRVGRQVKTDRRDALQLAHFLRSGDLVEVVVPAAETEAMRDLERARDDAKNAERAARHQLDKFLLRQGRLWSERKWTVRHVTWLRTLQFDNPVQQRVLNDYLRAVEECGQRVRRLEQDIEESVGTWSLQPLVLALQALRGVQLLTAVIILAEVGDFRRFASPRELMAYLGLVPSEHSSGERRVQGRITRCGNQHVRRILIESAWNYRFRPRVSAAIAERRQRVSPEVRAIAEKAEQRLCRRFERLTSRGKSKVKAVTAIARELAGFVWAITRVEQPLQA
jgi:transposase